MTIHLSQEARRSFCVNDLQSVTDATMPGSMHDYMAHRTEPMPIDEGISKVNGRLTTAVPPEERIGLCGSIPQSHTVGPWRRGPIMV